MYLPLPDSSFCAGSPYQQVYIGPRCFFPLGVIFGYIPGCCNGFCGYAGCIATPVSVITCPFDCLMYSCVCCSNHNCSQRKSKCTSKHCQRFKKFKEMDTTCCAFGDENDSCTGYYPPLEFDEIYYQCPQCVENANITTCICQTRFDDAVNLGQTITSDLCVDCAFLPFDDDRVLTSNMYGEIKDTKDMTQIVPVLAFKRKDNSGYDIRRNYYGPGNGQLLGNIPAKDIYKRVMSHDSRQKILKEIMDVPVPNKYKIYCFHSIYYSNCETGSPTFHDAAEIKRYIRITHHFI